MKILHCGDIHYKNDLVTEISKCTDFMVEHARKENVNLSIIAGDIFDERHYYDTIAYKHAIEFIKKLSEVSPVYVLKGTNSHDGSSLKFLETLSTKKPVFVAESIGPTLWLNDFVEDIDYDRLIAGLEERLRASAIIFSLPPVSKANLLAHGGNDIEESRIDTIDALRDVLQMFGTISEKAHAQGIPTILTGHLTVTGSTISTGQQMIGREVELGVGDLRMTGVDLVCLGHIHKMQSWGEIFYSGSITRLNFGEEEDKGFWIHKFDGHNLVSSDFIITPARKMVTVNLNSDSIDSLLSEITESTHVKVKYSTPEDEVHKFNEDEIREKLIASGVSEVKIEKTVIPIERIRVEGISKLGSLEDKLNKWGESSGVEITDGVIEKLRTIDFLDEAKDKLENAAA